MNNKRNFREKARAVVNKKGETKQEEEPMSILDEKQNVLQQGRHQTRSARKGAGAADATASSGTGSSGVNNVGILDEKRLIASRRQKIPMENSSSDGDVENMKSGDTSDMAPSGTNGDDLSMLEEKRLIGSRHQMTSSDYSTSARRKKGRCGAENSVNDISPSDTVMGEKKRRAIRTKRGGLAIAHPSQDSDGSSDSADDCYPPQPASQPGVVRVQGSAPEQHGSIRIGITDGPHQPVRIGSTHNGFLVQAHMVLDGEGEGNSKVLATATPDPWWRRHQWWLAGGAVIVVVAIVLAVLLTTVDFGSGSTDAPSMAPTSVAESVEDEIRSLIEPALPDDEAVRLLSDVTTPQYRALQWVVTQRLSNDESYTVLRVKQEYSLAALFFGTGGGDSSSWLQSEGWLVSDSVCDWYGVSCDADNTVVTELHLGANGLNGTLSSDLVILGDKLSMLDVSDNAITGKLPVAFGELTALTHLSLKRNNLTESIPSSFGGMEMLQTLDLSANFLSSTIPTELGSLSMLQELNLEQNDFIGPVPSQFGSLSDLEHMYVSENRLSFALPSELGRLMHLKKLDAHGNSLLGPLPSEIGRLKSLENLDLSENFIFSEMPGEVTGLSSLTSLDLSHNLFTGSLPPFDSSGTAKLSVLRVNGNFLDGEIPRLIPSLARLVELDLSSNFFSGHLPTSLPRWLPKLGFFDASSNSLEGSVYDLLQGGFHNEEFIPSLTTSNLTVLHLAGNDMQGTIPSEIGSLSQLVSLDVSHNAINGPIPFEVWELTGLELLNLQGNEMSGTGLSTTISAMTRLRELRISDNQFRGSIPSQIGMLTSLEIFLAGLELHATTSNQGTLPTEIGMLTELREILVRRTGISGTLPSEIFRLSKLTRLDVGSNQLVGNIPTNLGMLTRLQMLRLESNQFGQVIPSEMGLLTELREANLEFNSLVGAIPTAIGLLAGLQFLSLGRNSLEGSLPSEVGRLTDLRSLSLPGNFKIGDILPTEVGRMSLLDRFDFAENNFVGNLPSEIGHMTFLTELSVRSNDLSGSLPSEIGKLTNLVGLDLSSNPFFGPLPSEIGNVGTLKGFNISGTEFTGTVPSSICEPDVQYDGLVSIVNLVVDCGKVSCSCCCPIPSPTTAPSASAVPTSSPSPSFVEDSSFCSRFTSISSFGSRLSISDTEHKYTSELVSNFGWQNAMMGFYPLRVLINGVVDLERQLFCDFPCPDDFVFLPIPRIVVARSDVQPIVGGGEVYAAQVDDTVVISWEAVRLGGEDGQSEFNFQVVLYPSGSIEMRWGDGDPQSDNFSIEAFLDDGVNVTVPVTGAPYIESNASGVAHDWPRNQCRLFNVTSDGGYVELK